MDDLKEKTIRGGVARVAAQGANFVLRIGSLTVLARILGPKDFGLVGMAVAFTGVLDWFKDFGLSSAAVQSPTVTEEQRSTLFWINTGVGLLFALLAACAAPLIADFYHDPRLVGIVLVLATAFLFNGAGVQHSVILQRQLRFVTMSTIYTVSLMVGTGLAIWAAMAGYGYWALIVTTVTLPLFNTIGCWVATRWIPGRPHRGCGIRRMVHFGGTVTGIGLVYYLNSNLEKILLGRYWGAVPLGIYGRGYQLGIIPSENLNYAAGEVAFPALARLQDEPVRFRDYFLKGYSVILAMTLSITIACALFADDVVRVALGAKWDAVVPILQLLCPAILVLALVNPLGWLIVSLGNVKRGLAMAVAMTPLIAVGCVLGLQGGPKWVAVGYSSALLLYLVPAIFWVVRDTPISAKDIFTTILRPLLSALAAGAIAWGARIAWGNGLSHSARLALECGVFFLAFVALLFYVAGQKALYMRILRQILSRSSRAEEPVASATQ